MNLRHIAIAAALAASAIASQAAEVVTTSGGLTTYTENFNGSSSFAGGTRVNGFGNDDFLLITRGNDASTTFSAGSALTSATLSFWYSTPFDGATVTIASGGNALAPTSGALYLLNNPGAGGVSSADRFVSYSFSDVPAGDYTISFSSGLNALNSLKIDDVSIAVSPVPEPETYALMLGGLLAVGFVARRKGARQA